MLKLVKVIKITLVIVEYTRIIKVKKAKIRYRYNQVPHLTQDFRIIISSEKL